MVLRQLINILFTSAQNRILIPISSPHRWSIRANQERNDLFSFFRGSEQQISFLPTASFQKGRGLAIGERQRMVRNPPACPPNAFYPPVCGSAVDGGGICRKVSGLTEFVWVLRFRVFPRGEGAKGRFQHFFRQLPNVFLRLKSPLAFPLNHGSQSTYGYSLLFS